MAAKLARLKKLEAKEEAAKQQSLQQLPTNNFSFPSQYSGFLYSQPNAVGRSNLSYNYSQQFDPRLWRYNIRTMLNKIILTHKEWVTIIIPTIIWVKVSHLLHLLILRRVEVNTLPPRKIIKPIFWLFHLIILITTLILTHYVNHYYLYCCLNYVTHWFQVSSGNLLCRSYSYYYVS